MKSLRKIIVMLMFLMLPLFIFTSTIEAKSLEVTKYNIDVDVRSNGDVRFKEEMTFTANGSYNGIFYNLDYFGEKEPKDVTVDFKTSNGEVVTLLKSDTGHNSTYLTENLGSLLKFKVFLPFADSSRTVVFNYTIPQLIKNYKDTAELNRRVVGQEWEVTQKDIHVHVSLPGAATKETLRAWGHGGIGGKVAIDSDYKGVTFTVKKNEPKSFVETHIVFPVELTKDNPVTNDFNAFAAIVDREEQLVKRDQEERSVKWGVVGLGGLLSLVALGWAWVKGYLADKKRLEKVPFVPEHLYELPEDITPAIMSAAIYDGVTIDDFSATIMDLVRKKVLAISNEEPYILELKQDSYRLLPHEQLALDILFKKIAKGNTLDLDLVSEFAENCPERYTDMLENWYDEVDVAADEYSVYRFEEGETAPKAVGANLLGIAGFLLFVGSVFWATKNLFLTIVAGIISFIIYLVTVRFSKSNTKQRSIKGEYEYRRWEAFRQMLIDISSLDRADLPSIQIWDHLLVYAISLGVAEQVIEVLEEKFPDWIQESVFYSLTYGWQMAVYNEILQDTFTDSYHSAVNEISLSSDSSNSGGFGGGFSGGSSFGSGGGSGGGGF